VLGGLLADAGRRQAMAAGGRQLAARWTHHHVALALLPTLEALAVAGSGTVLRPGHQAVAGGPQRAIRATGAT